MKKTIFTLMAVLTAAMGFAQTPVTPPDGIQFENYTLGGYMMYYDDNGKQTEELVNRAVLVGINGNDIYISGMCYYMPEAWIKGTISSNKTTITVASPQFWGTYAEKYPIWFQAMTVQGEAYDFPASVTWNYNAETGDITMPESFYYYEVSGTTDQDSWYNLYGYMSLKKSSTVAIDVVTLPEGVTADDYVFSAKNYENADDTHTMKVAISGNDVYMNGISEILPEAWIKGTMAGGKVTFAANQYLGSYLYQGQTLNFFFNPEADVVFDYDATAAKFTAAHYVTTYEGGSYDEFSDIVITRLVEKPATPATPVIAVIGNDQNGAPRMGFDVPLVDTDGNALLTSKLYLKFYTKTGNEVSDLIFKADKYKTLEQDLALVPYGFTDEWDFFANSIYFYDDYTAWDMIGIQSVYIGGGETHQSDINWFDIQAHIAGIGAIKGQAGNQDTYYNLQGQKVAKAGKGLYIHNGKKVIVRH